MKKQGIFSTLSVFWREFIFDLRVWLVGDGFLQYKRDIGVTYNNWLLIERDGKWYLRRIGQTLGEQPTRFEWKMLMQQLRWRRIEQEKLKIREVSSD